MYQTGNHQLVADFEKWVTTLERHSLNAIAIMGANKYIGISEKPYHIRFFLFPICQSNDGAKRQANNILS